ncbi:hypothetical protein BJX96DRAFT_74222 [Aspergillus floccosus]
MVKNKHKKKNFLQTTRNGTEEHTMDTPTPPEAYSDLEIEEYTQRGTSPYSTQAMILHIGPPNTDTTSRYIVPEYHLRPYPQLNTRWGDVIQLSDIHPDVGHTLVHYLYTGAYETLKRPSSERSQRAIEFQRSVHVYHAARVYEISGLEQYAKEYMRRFDDAATLFDILDVGREVFSKLPDDETWFQEYIAEKMASTLEADEESFKYNLIRYKMGQDSCFDPLILRIILDLSFTRHEASPKADADGGSLVVPSDSLQLEHEYDLEPQEEPDEEATVEMECVPVSVEEPVPEVTAESSPVEAPPPDAEPVEEPYANGTSYRHLMMTV